MTVVPVEATADVRAGSTTYYIDNQLIASAEGVPLNILGDYARGSIIIGGVAVWEDLVIGAAGSALTSDGTDISWDNTPTWTGLHQFDAGIDLNGVADALILDADGDTTISAPTGNQIDIEIAGADDFSFTANSFNVLSGSSIVMADGASIGNGVSIVFDDTGNELEISGGNVVIGATTSNSVEKLVVQGDSAINVVSSLYAGDGDGTDFVSIILYGIGTPGSIVNRERLLLQYDSAGLFRIQSEANGTGTLRALVIETEGNANQLFLNTDGSVGVGTIAPQKLVDMSADNDTTLRISSTKNGSGWTGLNFGLIEFYSADASGPGAGVRGSITVAAGIDTGGNADMAFGVSSSSSANVTRIFIDGSSGRIGIGLTTGITGKLHVDQASASGVIPVLTLDQGDTSEQCIQVSSDGADRDIHIVTVDVTGTPSWDWNESDDSFAYNKNINMVGATRNIYFGRAAEAGPIGLDFANGELIMVYHTTPNTLAFENASNQELLGINVAAGEVVVNEDSLAGIDFRVESDADINMLFVDGTNNRVGVGTAATSGKLSVDQSGAAGAIPVLTLDQGDTSEQCIKVSSDGSDRDIHIVTVDVTGTPAWDWDEGDDTFVYNEDINVRKNQNGATYILCSNAMVGASSLAGLRATSDTADAAILTHSSGRGATLRYGVSVADYSEFLAIAGTGMLIGTGSINGPVVFGTNSNERMRITGAGNVGINKTVPTSKLSVDQSSGSGAIPVLTLDQGDMSEEMMELLCTIGVGNAIEAVGGKVLTTTHFIKVTIQGGLTRYFPVGTIAPPV